jgi:GNAT superfamily N-acetyltransferase
MLAATYACDESDFLRSGVRFTTPEERPGRIRWPLRKLTIGTMGDGVVACCAPEWQAWLRPLLANRSRDDVFQPDTVSRIVPHIPPGLMLRGPALKYLCTEESFRPAPEIPDEISVVRGREIAELYQYPGFDDALAYETWGRIQDQVAAVAWRAGEPIGMAGASDDTEGFWQIGVTVLPGEQGRGLGRALVSRVTQEVLAHGILPYYTTATANIRSRAVAVSLGYWPAWTELYTRAREQAAGVSDGTS